MIQLKPEDFKAVECVPVPEIVVKMAALALSRGEDGMDEFLQLPKVEDVPRPGAVRGWEIDDWRNFAIKSGWKEVEQTKHQFLFEHRVWTDGIRFGIAKTPGDWRSGMNSCSDLRKRFLSWRMMLYTALKALAEGGLIPKPVAKIWGDLPREPVADIYRSVLSYLPMVHDFLQASDLRRIENTAMVVAAHRAIDSVVREGLVQNRRQGVGEFLKWADVLLENQQEAIDSLRDLLLEAPPDHPIPEAIVAMVREWSREVRDTAKIEKEMLREERSKKKAERQESKRQEEAAADRPKTPEQMHAEAIETTNKKVASVLSDALALVTQTLEACPKSPSDYSWLRETVDKHADELMSKTATLADVYDKLEDQQEKVARYEAWLRGAIEKHARASCGSPEEAMLVLDEALAGNQRTKDLEAFLLEAVDAIFESDWAKMGTKVMALRTRAETLIPAGNNHASSKGNSNDQA